MRGEGQGQEYANSGSSPVIRMRTSRTDHFSLASTFSTATVKNKVPRNKGKGKLFVHAKQYKNCHNMCSCKSALYNYISNLTELGKGQNKERG